MKASNESSVPKIRCPAAPTSLMSGEPDAQPSHACDHPRSSPNLDSAQEIVKLFDEVHAPLQRYLTFLGLSREDAEDCIQEAFLRLHKRFDSLSDLTNVRGWLFHVAKNLARDKRKTAWERRTSVSRRDSERVASMQDARDTPEASLLKQEQAGMVSIGNGAAQPAAGRMPPTARLRTPVPGDRSRYGNRHFRRW